MKKITFLLLALICSVTTWATEWMAGKAQTPVTGTDYLITVGGSLLNSSGKMTSTCDDTKDTYRTYFWQIEDAGDGNYYIKNDKGYISMPQDVWDAITEGRVMECGYAVTDAYDYYNYAGFNAAIVTAKADASKFTLTTVNGGYKIGLVGHDGFTFDRQDEDFAISNYNENSVVTFCTAVEYVATGGGAEVTNPVTQMTDGMYITLQCMDTNGGDGYYFNGAAAKSATLGYANYFKIVSNGADAFYLQRVSDGKYVACAGNNAAVTMADDQTGAAAFTFSIATATSWTTTGTAANNGVNTVRFTTNSTFLNTQGTTVTPKYFTGTGGFSIWQVKTYTEAEVNAWKLVGNFSFKNNRSGKYAVWTGDDSQVGQNSTMTIEGVWTITYDGTSYKLGNKATSKYYASKNSFTADGIAMYIGSSTNHEGCYNISESSTFEGSTCWDDQDNNTHVGYWYANDEGTSWIITAVTDEQIEALQVDNSWAVTLPENLPNIKIGDKANSITAATAADDNDHWFLMTQTRDGESPMYDVAKDSQIKRAAATITPSSLNNAVAADNVQYLVRFCPSSVSGAYNVQFANGNYISSSLTTVAKVNSAASFLVYNIASSDTHIGWNLTTDGTTYSSRIDNNGAGSTVSLWSSGEITSTGGNNDWSVYPVTFIEAPKTHDVTVNLTDAAGNAFTATVTANIGDDPTLTGAYGYTLSNKTWSVDGNTLTATITFPFATSSETTKNATAIQSDLGSNQWCASEGNVIATNAAKLTPSVADNYRWYIYPTLTSDGQFKFKLYNVGAKKYIPVSGSVSTAPGTATALADEGGEYSYWLINTGAGFGLTDGSNKFLTVNSSATNQNIWLWSYTAGAGHRGSNLSFPELDVYTDAEMMKSEIETLAATAKFELVDGATIISPSEYATPSEINAAIDAAKAVDTSDETAMSTFLASDNATKIKTFNSASASYGAPLICNYTAKANKANADASYNTIILPINFSKPSNWTLYTCAAIEGTTLTLTEATSGTNKNTPFIVKTSNTADETFQFIGYSNGAGTTDVTPEGSLITGVLTEGGTSISSGYVLQNHNGLVAFYNVTSDITVPTYHCYLTYEEAAPETKALYFDNNGEETAISSINANSNENAAIFNLAGQRVNKAQKGIYIINGKKILK